MLDRLASIHACVRQSKRLRKRFTSIDKAKAKPYFNCQAIAYTCEFAIASFYTCGLVILWLHVILGLLVIRYETQRVLHSILLICNFIIRFKNTPVTPPFCHFCRFAIFLGCVHPQILQSCGPCCQTASWGCIRPRGLDFVRTTTWCRRFARITCRQPSMPATVFVSWILIPWLLDISSESCWCRWKTR